MAGSCDDAALSGYRRTHLETEDRFPICANVTMFQLWSPASLESTSHAGAWLHFIVMKHKWAANAKLFKRRFAKPGLQAQKFASVRSITWRSFPNEQGACETKFLEASAGLPYSARELSLETFRQFFRDADGSRQQAADLVQRIFQQARLGAPCSRLSNHSAVSGDNVSAAMRSGFESLVATSRPPLLRYFCAA